MSDWFTCHDRFGDPAFTLHCFPHSGGSAGEYVRWSGRLGVVGPTLTIVFTDPIAAGQ